MLSNSEEYEHDAIVYDSEDQEHIKMLQQLIVKGSDRHVELLYGATKVTCAPPRAYLNALLFNLYKKFGLTPDMSWFYAKGYTSQYKVEYPNMIIEKVRGLKEFESIQHLGNLLSGITIALKKMVVLGTNVSLDISITSWMDDINSNEKLTKLFSSPLITKKNTPEEVRDIKIDVIHDFKNMGIMEPIPTFLKSGTSISEDQIGNMFTLGIRPLPVKPNPAIPPELAMNITLDGRLNGLQNIEDKFIDDSTARLADIMSKRCIQDAGKTSKAVSLVVQEKSINRVDTGESVYDCGTKHTYDTILGTQKELDDMHGKYHVVDDKLMMIDKRDNSIIGKEIKIRTVAKCACKTGVCQVCVGAFAKSMMNNADTKYHFGVLGVKTLIATAAQLIISAKHNNKAALIAFTLLKINNGIPEAIDDKMQDCFVREGTEIVVNPKYNMYLVDIRDPTDEERKELNMDYVIGETLEFLDTTTGVVHTFRCNSEFRMYSKNCMNLNRLVIDGRLEYDINTMTARYKALNKALTDVYYKLLNILSMKIPNENGLSDSAYVDYLLLRARKEIPGFHFIPLEIIISSLLRNKGNHRESPDWASDNPTVEAIGLGKANRINRTTSVSKLLGLGNYNSILSTPDSYFGIEPSEYDVLYNVLKTRESTTKNSLMTSIEGLIKSKLK
ncbi:MAG: hypothetical protein ACRCX2_21670 [Paraclostridium sp.]